MAEAVLLSWIWGVPIALAGQLMVSSAFAEDSFALSAREFPIVCPSAIFEPNNLDGLMKKRGFVEADRDGDEDSEVVSYTQAGTNLSFVFGGSPNGAPRKEIWNCSLFLQRPTPIQQLDALFERLTRDPRVSGLQKLPVKASAGVAQIKAARDTGDGCLSLDFMSFDTPGQKTTQLLMGRTTGPCKNSNR
jgi:hypothetical protein